MARVLTLPGPGGKERVVLPRITIRDAAAGKSTDHCDELVAVLTALYECGSDDPSQWAHEAERMARVEAVSTQSWTPRPGSTAAAGAYRNGGVVPSGRFW
jgi:hypothetical protein